MRGSGKQVLLRILAELSTKITPEEDLPRATRRLRAGLLLHGSTSDESFECTSRLSWASKRPPEEGGVSQQGIAVGDTQILLTELYNSVFYSMPGLKEHVLREHPSLDAEAYRAFEWVMWLLVSSVQMYGQLVEVENTDELDVDEWVEMLSRKYDYHFSEEGTRERLVGPETDER